MSQALESCSSPPPPPPHFSGDLIRMDSQACEILATGSSAGDLCVVALSRTQTPQTVSLVWYFCLATVRDLVVASSSLATVGRRCSQRWEELRGWLFSRKHAKGSFSINGRTLHWPTSPANFSRDTSPANFPCQLFESYFTCQLLLLFFLRVTSPANFSCQLVESYFACSPANFSRTISPANFFCHLFECYLTYQLLLPTFRELLQPPFAPANLLRATLPANLFCQRFESYFAC